MTTTEVKNDNAAVKTAEAFSAAFKALSSEKLSELYDDNIVVWHGSTKASQTKSENINFLAMVFKLAKAMEYIEVKRFPIEGGVVQQHRLVGTFSDGTPMPSLEACLIMMVKDNKIIKIDEYFDGGQYAEVWARLAQPNG